MGRAVCVAVLPGLWLRYRLLSTLLHDRLCAVPWPIMHGWYMTLKLLHAVRASRLRALQLHVLGSVHGGFCARTMVLR